MEWICNDNDFSDVRYAGGLINATSDSKEFSFSSCDVYSMVYCFDNGLVINMNMGNGDGDIVSDTSIGNDKSTWGIQRGDNYYFI